jgi:hypothetical protein
MSTVLPDLYKIAENAAIRLIDQTILRFLMAIFTLLRPPFGHSAAIITKSSVAHALHCAEGSCGVANAEEG